MRLTPEREKQIRDWVMNGGDIRSALPYIFHCLEEIDALRADLQKMNDLTEWVRQLEVHNKKLQDRHNDLYRIKSCAMLLISHWKELGPDHDFEESVQWLDRAIKMQEMDE